jgi:hypothetical protein
MVPRKMPFNAPPKQLETLYSPVASENKKSGYCSTNVAGNTNRPGHTNHQKQVQCEEDEEQLLPRHRENKEVELPIPVVPTERSEQSHNCRRIAECRSRITDSELDEYHQHSTAEKTPHIEPPESAIGPPSVDMPAEHPERKSIEEQMTRICVPKSVRQQCPDLESLEDGLFGDQEGLEDNRMQLGRQNRKEEESSERSDQILEILSKRRPCYRRSHR